MKPVIVLRPISEYGTEWVNAPGVKLSDGIPSVREPSQEAA